MKWYAIVKDSKPLEFLTADGKKTTTDMVQAKLWEVATDAVQFIAGRKDVAIANEDWVGRENAKNHTRKRHSA